MAVVRADRHLSSAAVTHCDQLPQVSGRKPRTCHSSALAHVSPEVRLRIVIAFGAISDAVAIVMSS